MKTLSAIDFAQAFGLESLPEQCLATIARANFQYADADLKTCVLEVLKTLNSELPIAGQVAKWEAGWQENLKEYLATGSLDALMPKYFFKHSVLRYKRKYIQPVSPRFEADYYTVVCQILFHKYLSEANSIIEFGAGTGFSLMILSEMFPEKPLVGCDWAKPSQLILRAIAEKTGKPIIGVNFNMFSPPHEYSVVPFREKSAVITVLAMEQLGTNYQPFLDYLLAKKPSICVHLEPIVELYHEHNLLDYLALRYHRKRQYLDGFLTSLKGKVELIDVRRLYFGSFFHEAYSVVVWRPR